MIDSKYSGLVGGAASGAATGSAFGTPGAVVGGLLGGLGGFFGGDGDKQAKKIAEDNAKLIEATGTENQRRMRLQLGRLTGGIQAGTGQSNLQFGGSSERYQNVADSQFRADMAWDRFTTRKNANLAREGGQAAANQIQAGSLTAMLGGLGQAVTAFAPKPKTKPPTP